MTPLRLLAWTGALLVVAAAAGLIVTIVGGIVYVIRNPDAFKRDDADG